MDDFSDFTPRQRDEPPVRRGAAPQPSGGRGPAVLRRNVLLVVAAVVVIGFLIFWLQNHERVSISYLTVEVSAPLWLVVTTYFVVGAIVGAALAVFLSRR